MINKLTKAQEEAIIPFREKWIDRILRTEQTDEEIKNNIKGIYKLAGLKEPKEVWIMDSMFGVQIAINFIKNAKEIDSKNIWSNIDSNIDSNIWSNKLDFFGFSSNESTFLHWYIYQKYYFDNGLLLPDKYSELLNSYIEMAIDAWAVYYSPDIAIVSRKPIIKRNNGRLHSTNSPAVLS